jgi:hypothetical protein
MLRILLFSSGYCSKTEVFEQLYSFFAFRAFAVLYSKVWFNTPELCSAEAHYKYDVLVLTACRPKILAGFYKAVYSGVMDTQTPSDNPPLAYVLRVNIADSRPKIWRKLRVPENCTLGDLHKILQVAFGWENSHMHSFTVNSIQYGMPLEDMGFDDEFDIVDEDTVCLSQLDLQPKQKFTYLYDFGDSWQHEITVSKIVPIGAEDKESMGPCCLDGERAGPLEDSGGIWGYEEMLEVLKDPGHKDYEDIHEWAGDFDSEYVGLEDINKRLKQIFKPRQTKGTGKSRKK